MVKKAFSLIARNKYLELFSEFISQAMENQGYEEEIEMRRPDSPQIWQFNKEGNIIAMSINPSGGTLSSESEITVEAETDSGMDEVYQIVGNAIALMMKHYSKKVFDAIGLSEIDRHLDDLKKEV
jgi:hypothetical protein